MMQVNARKTQKNLHPTELERYSAKLLGKAEMIVSSAGRIWGVLSQSVICLLYLLTLLERDMQVESEE